MDKNKIEIKYRKSSKAAIIFAGFMILPLGLLILGVKEEIEHLPFFAIVGIVPPVFLSYKKLSQQDRRILEYMDFRRYIILVMIAITAIFLPYGVFKISFNKILGWIFVIGGGGIALFKLLEIVKGKKGNIPKSEVLILDKKGIKIPDYREIPWNEINEVLEYKDGGNDITGIIVNSALNYKEKITFIDRVFFGKSRRMIQIKNGLLISEDKNIDAKVSRYINSRVKK